MRERMIALISSVLLIFACLAALAVAQTVAIDSADKLCRLAGMCH